MSSPETADFESILEVFDNVLSAALREVRKSRARVSHVAKSPLVAQAANTARPSNTTATFDVLTSAGKPLHISAILAALGARGLIVSRESLVSALSKKLAPLGKFVRTAPNTFGIVGRDRAAEVP